MKKLALFFAAIVISAMSFGQSNLVLSAFNYMKDGRLDKALQSIEPTIVHPKTMSDPKTWLYRGTVYYRIAITDEEKYKSLCQSPLDSAYVSFQKSIALDKNFVAISSEPQTAQGGLYLLRDEFYNIAAHFYNGRDFTSARSNFERARQIKKSFNETDTLSTYYSYKCAMQMQDTVSAVKYLKELIDNDFKEPEIYAVLSTLYFEDGDTTNSFKTISKGRTRFPNDVVLIVCEADYYIAKGDLAGAQKIQAEAEKKDPTNPKLFFTFGVNFDKHAKDVKRSQAEKESMINEAEKAYVKAIELDPKFFDAYYNIGAMFFNYGADLFALADQIPPDQVAAYKEAKDKYMLYWNKALPYLEKASEMKPDDLSTLRALKTLYGRLNLLDKQKVVTDKINELTK